MKWLVALGFAIVLGGLVFSVYELAFREKRKAG